MELLAFIPAFTKCSPLSLFGLLDSCNVWNESLNTAAVITTELIAITRVQGNIHDLFSYMHSYVWNTVRLRRGYCISGVTQCWPNCWELYHKWFSMNKSSKEQFQVLATVQDPHENPPLWMKWLLFQIIRISIYLRYTGKTWDPFIDPRCMHSRSAQYTGHQCILELVVVCAYHEVFPVVLESPQYPAPHGGAHCFGSQKVAPTSSG